MASILVKHTKKLPNKITHIKSVSTKPCDKQEKRLYLCSNISSKILVFFILYMATVTPHGYTLRYIKPAQPLHGHTAYFTPAYIPFRTAMGPLYNECNAAISGKYLSATAPEPAARLLTFFEQLYEQAHPAHIKPDDAARIPQTIHQIWLGSRLPEKFKRWQESWLATHPDWDYILWTDIPGVHNPDLAARYPRYKEQSIMQISPLYNQTLYLNAPNYGAKSDILRVEILHAFGGVYVDMDIECIEPFTHLHRCYDFYAGIESLEFLWLSLNNGVIGSVPAHPILTHYMHAMHKHTTLGASIFETQSTTGPLAFTRAFWAAANEKGFRDIALPARYFGPIDCFGNIVIWPETYACQYFTHSWIPNALQQLTTSVTPSPTART